jgi:hypothetical protein
VLGLEYGFPLGSKSTITTPDGERFEHPHDVIGVRAGIYF